MSPLRPLFLALLFGMFVSCSGKNDKSMQAFVKTDTCRTDAGNSYEVFVPAHKASEKLPLLVIVDSHGGGRFALEKFKATAKTYHLILAASNTVRNGFVGFEQALQTLVDDVRQKYPAGKTLFLTGFSGGARMALGYALSHPSDGLILCGALADAGQLSAANCPVISVSGMDDFNFPETAQYLFQEQSTPANLKIELTHSSHSWPDAPMIATTVCFLMLSANRDATIAQTAIEAYTRQQASRIDSLKKSNEWLQATLIARNMASVAAFDQQKEFAKACNVLKADSHYLAQLNKLGACLNTEMQLRQTYIDAFQHKNIRWWSNEIDDTNRAIATEKDPFTVDMYRRIKGFWGIACYSLCKQAVAKHAAGDLQKVLAVYQLIEPQNADMWYFSAFLPYWEGNTAATKAALEKAKMAGFADKTQMEKEFNVRL